MSKKNTAQFWDTAHRYLDHQLKVIRQVSSHTIDSYRDCLNSFINYLERVENVGRKKISFHNFEKETIKRYQTWMIMEQGLAPKTCNLRLTAIRAFLEYAAQEYLWIMPVYTDALFTYNIYYFTIIQLRWLLIDGIIFDDYINRCILYETRKEIVAFRLERFYTIYYKSILGFKGLKRWRRIYHEGKQNIGI